ncbi:MAG: hypothetical protein WCA78_15555 [Rhizomicrobium sp.]
MNTQILTGFWRPRPSPDTSLAWSTQLDELAKVEVEVQARIDALESGRGALLISGTADEVAKAETALAVARAELERVPVMRTEIIARRERAAAREEITKFEAERAKIKAEVDGVTADLTKIAELVAPVVALLQREKAAHWAVEDFNRRYREMVQRRELKVVDLLSAPIEAYWAGGTPFPYPIWRATKIPTADLKSWLWNEDRR